MSIDWMELWRLGGHGVFVWPGYAAAATLVSWEAVVLLRRLRQSAVANQSPEHEEETA